VKLFAHIPWGAPDPNGDYRQRIPMVSIHDSWLVGYDDLAGLARAIRQAHALWLVGSLNQTSSL